MQLREKWLLLICLETGDYIFQNIDNFLLSDVVGEHLDCSNKCLCVFLKKLVACVDFGYITNNLAKC
jgi:hypothetical protein